MAGIGGQYSQFTKNLDDGTFLRLTNMGIFDPESADDSHKPWAQKETLHMWHLHLYDKKHKLKQTWQIPYYGSGSICPELFADLLNGCAKELYPH